MQNSDVKSILLNAGAGVLVLGTFAFMLRSLLVTEVIPPCSARFPQSVEFHLENGDAPMSPVQLVGQMGDSQRGVYRNAKVVQVRDVTSKHALKITLRPDREDSHTDGEGNGIAFQWSPAGMKGSSSACLSYSVYLPEKFEFGEGGVLPGLYAGRQASLSEVLDGKVAAAQRIVWKRDGQANVYAQIPGYDVNGGLYLQQGGIALPLGRWVSFEQEIKLNDLGKKNGYSRLFVDGEMKIEKKGIEWRTNGKLTLSGTDASISYAALRRDARPPKETAIYMTPLQLRWK